MKQMLILHAPPRNLKTRQSYNHTVTSGVGRGYAIYPSICKRIQIGGKVAVIEKTTNSCAIGVIGKICSSGRAGNGVTRYDVHIKNLTNHPGGVSNVKLNRCGVAFI